MDTRFLGTTTTIYKFWSSGEGGMSYDVPRLYYYDGAVRYGPTKYYYDVESAGTPEFSIPIVPTVVIGGSGSTPEQISGWSFDLNEDMIVGVHVSGGIDSPLHWEFTGHNSGSGSIGPNIGLGLSLSYTTIYGPYAPDGTSHSPGSLLECGQSGTYLLNTDGRPWNSQPQDNRTLTFGSDSIFQTAQDSLPIWQGLPGITPDTASQSLNTNPLQNGLPYSLTLNGGQPQYWDASQYQDAVPLLNPSSGPESNRTLAFGSNSTFRAGRGTPPIWQGLPSITSDTGAQYVNTNPLQNYAYPLTLNGTQPQYRDASQYQDAVPLLNPSSGPESNRTLAFGSNSTFRAGRGAPPIWQALPGIASETGAQDVNTTNPLQSYAYPLTLDGAQPQYWDASQYQDAVPLLNPGPSDAGGKHAASVRTSHDDSYAKDYERRARENGREGCSLPSRGSSSDRHAAPALDQSCEACRD